MEAEEKTLLYWGDKNIGENVVDMVCIGRQLLADPLIPAKLSEGREKEVKWCIACDNCVEFLNRQKPVGCPVHNKFYTEALKQILQEEGDLKRI